jgi:hypothetical protein
MRPQRKDDHEAFRQGLTHDLMKRFLAKTRNLGCRVVVPLDAFLELCDAGGRDPGRGSFKRRSQLARTVKLLRVEVKAVFSDEIQGAVRAEYAQEITCGTKRAPLALEEVLLRVLGQAIDPHKSLPMGTFIATYLNKEQSLRFDKRLADSAQRKIRDLLLKSPTQQVTLTQDAIVDDLQKLTFDLCESISRRIATSDDHFARMQTSP